MENVIAALIIIGLIIFAAVGLSERSFSTQSALAEASQVMQERVAERARTGLTAATAVTTGNMVQVTLKNTGQIKLADWAHWDVILEYSNGSGRQLKWFPYGTTGGWAKQIYMTTAPLVDEAIEPGILNPDEYLVIQVDVTSDPVGTGTTNLATVTTPNGVTATAIFTY